MHNTAPDAAAGSPAADELSRYGDIPIEIAVELDRTPVSITEIAALRRGSTVALSKPAGENVELYVGEARIASGEILLLDDRMAVRITDIFGLR